MALSLAVSELALVEEHLVKVELTAEAIHLYLIVEHAGVHRAANFLVDGDNVGVFELNGLDVLFQVVLLQLLPLVLDPFVILVDGLGLEDLFESVQDEVLLLECLHLETPELKLQIELVDVILFFKFWLRHLVTEELEHQTEDIWVSIDVNLSRNFFEVYVAREHVCEGRPLYRCEYRSLDLDASLSSDIEGDNI
jgi:hypothetical protein